MMLPLDVDVNDPAFDAVKPGWTPFLIVLLLGVVITFLYFSMRKQLRKIRFPEDAPNGDASGPDAHGLPHSS